MHSLKKRPGKFCLVVLLFSVLTHANVLASTIKGSIGGIGKSGGDYFATGWACQTGHSSSIAIRLFAGGPAGVGTKFMSTVAKLPSGSGVNSACNTSGSKHRFRVKLSESVLNAHGGKKLYIHGMSPLQTGNLLISGSGRHTIPAPPPPPTPDAPTSISAPSRITVGTKMTVTWNGPNSTNYVLSRNGAQVYSNSGKSFSETLNTIGSFVYSVKSCLSGVCNPSVKSFTVTVVKPEAPNPVNASVSGNDLTVTWKNLEEDYYIQYRIGNGGWLGGSTRFEGNSKTWSDFPPITNRSFRVKACDRNSGVCSDWSTPTPGVTILPVPLAPSVSAQQNDLTIEWTQTTPQAERYQLQYRVENGTWVTESTTLTGDNTSLQNFQAANNLSFRLNACNEWSCTNWSSPSNSITILDTPAAPNIDTSGLKITLTWDPNANADYHELRYRDGNGQAKNSPLKFGSGGETYQTWDTIGPVTNRSFSTRACLSTGNNCTDWSPWSAPITTTEVQPPPGTVTLASLATGPENNIIIQSDQTVYITSNVEARLIKVHGKLICEDNVVATVTVQGIEVNGSNAELVCGTSSDKGNFFSGKVIFNLKPGNGVMIGNNTKAIMAANGGTIRLHGKPGKHQYRRLINMINTVNATELQIEGDISGWQVNDKIVIASTDFDTGHTETRTITKKEGNRVTLNEIDGNGVILEAPLQFGHYGAQRPQDFSGPAGKSWALDERAEIINLNRNIVITSDIIDFPSYESGPVTLSEMEAIAADENNITGANVMVMMGGKAFIDNVEFSKVGQLGKLGRYPFHWHEIGNAEYQYIKNSSIHHSYNRCVTIHSTNNATVENNTCFNHFGHGYFLEDGSEIGNTISNNIGLVSRRLPHYKNGKEIDVTRGWHLLESDTDISLSARRFSAPATFWVANPNNKIYGNIAAGSEGTGFWMAFSPEVLTGNNGASVDTDIFSNNVAHSSLVGFTHDGGPTNVLTGNDRNGALDTKLKIGTGYYQPNTVPIFKNIVAYRNALTAIYYRGSNAIFENAVVANNHVGIWFAYDQQLVNSLVAGATNNIYANDATFNTEASHLEQTLLKTFSRLIE